MKLRAKRIAIILERNVYSFVEPKRELEQYRTPPEIAVEMTMYLANSSRCATIVDLGSGTGMLTYASSLFKLYSIGIDIDISALKLAKASSLYQELVVDFINASVGNMPIRGDATNLCITQNPPFGGTTRKSTDIFFLESALSLRPELLTSIHFHGRGVLGFIANYLKEKGYKILRVTKRRFPLKASYEFHRKRIHYIGVIIIFAKRCTDC